MKTFSNGIRGLLLGALCLFPNLLPAAAGGKQLQVAATTSIVGDLVKTIGGDHVEVRTLMGPGVDPHLYKATPSDVRALQRASVIFYSGLMLEGKMEDLFRKMARGKKPVHAVTEALPASRLLSPPEFQGQHDPHVWLDVQLWSLCADTVAQGLSAVDPAGKDYYGKRAAEFRARMKELHEWAAQRIAEIPKERRILVTSHDAFNYFGRAYEFEVVGLQGISTVTEAGLADMTRLVDYIRQNRIKAIFVESSVPHNAIRRISQDAGVKIGGELLSDALGTPGQIENGYDLGTYEGMIRHNVNTIVEALK
jgi:manganese/zinc/iron transport system substrate-binding protein